MERYNGVEPDPEGAFVYYDDAQRALDAEREKVAKLEKIQAIDLKNNNEYREQLATLQAQLRQAEGERDHAKKMEAVQKEVADNQTWHVRQLQQLVAALPVVDVQEVSVWLSPDESGWLVSKRPAFPAGLYWAKFRTQAEADSFRALLAYRATLAQDAGKEPSHD